MMPALGSTWRPIRTRSCSRSAVLSCSQVASRRQNRKVVIGRLPRRELVGLQAPGTASLYNIEDFSQNLTNRMEPGSTQWLGRWEKWVKTGKLSVGEVGQAWVP